MNLLLYQITDIGLNIKYRRSIFSPQLKSMIYELTIKNDNGASAMSKIFVRREWKLQLHQLKKGKPRRIEDWLKCAPMFLFFISMKLKASHVTQNKTPKMEKNVHLY